MLFVTVETVEPFLTLTETDKQPTGSRNHKISWMSSADKATENWHPAPAEEDLQHAATDHHPHMAVAVPAVPPASEMRKTK
ncbi:hypothetical protein AVEN_202376-1 [Araneus ventricosus]|uniref:Uncharacterized protein n=1 Tax=Araneus ventricosus TaxID=182803 RepID=A0A4Y2MLZ2_ARAVE|nr:hypothetical protein AVEN_202376-1 [Araneus ventricosus]